MAGKGCIIPLCGSARRKVLLIAALIGILLAGCLMLFGGDRAPTVHPSLEAAAAGLPEWDVHLTLHPENRSLHITQTLQYRNAADAPLASLGLRTWLNAYAAQETSPASLEEIFDACYPEGFSPGWLDIASITWQAEEAAWAYTNDDRTALEVTIPPLAPGEEGVLRVEATAYIPLCAHRTGYADGVYQLGNVLPVLAARDGEGWRREEYLPIGDPFISDCANWRVSLQLPEGYVPACSVPLEKQEGIWQGGMLAARELGLCISADYKAAAARQGDTMVYSYARTEAGAKRALNYAKKALETYARLYGDYPWPAYTVCSVDFPFGGMEYPGFCMLGQGYYLESRADSLELLIAHETAHQWFYALVGSDSIRHPWQDEALCEYAVLRYVERRYGQATYETLKYFRTDAPMRENVPGNLTPGSPIDYFPNLTDYSTVVYGRGAALMEALNAIIPGGLDGFLRRYVEEYGFSFADRADFEALLTEYTGMDLTPLLIDYLDTVMDARNTNERVIA